MSTPIILDEGKDLASLDEHVFRLLSQAEIGMKIDAGEKPSMLTSKISPRYASRSYMNSMDSKVIL